jgi:hypothetical protein
MIQSIVGNQELAASLQNYHGEYRRVIKVYHEESLATYIILSDH